MRNCGKSQTLIISNLSASFKHRLLDKVHEPANSGLYSSMLDRDSVRRKKKETIARGWVCITSYSTDHTKNNATTGISHVGNVLPSQGIFSWRRLRLWCESIHWDALHTQAGTDLALTVALSCCRRPFPLAFMCKTPLFVAGFRRL